MMNQPLRRVDPLGRSTPLSPAHPSWPWPATLTAGSVSPIRRGSERAIVDSERDQVVVVKLERPGRVLAVLCAHRGSDDLADGRVLSGQGVGLALEARHRIEGLVARRVVPASDGGNAEFHGLSARRMLPAARGERLELDPELAGLRRRGEQLADDRKAQSGPAQPSGCVCLRQDGPLPCSE